VFICTGNDGGSQWSNVALTSKVMKTEILTQSATWKVPTNISQYDNAQVVVFGGGGGGSASGGGGGGGHRKVWTGKFTASSSFEDAISSKEGADFFADCIRQAKRQIHPDDVNRFLDVITKDNVLAEVEAHGVFSVSYRLMRGGAPRYVQLRAATVEDADGYTLIIGINDIDSQVKQEEEYKKRIAQAQREANQDVLTGVKNRHAYLEAEERLDQQIAEHREGDFAVVILDVNDLKLINDTEGHKAGDQYLKDASSIIAGIFKNSTIYRVGGDEFCTIVQDMDYERIDDLLKDMENHNARAIRTGGVVIACGMAKYEGDTNAAAVFERADQNMYQNKSDLKEGRAIR
jgi:diguanylate cyclase (GGDEF)-like protein